MSAAKDKEVKRWLEEAEEERDTLVKTIQRQKQEVNEWQEQVKLLESMKGDQAKKMAQLEESYKKTTGLFRQEIQLREETAEEESQRFEL